MLIRTELKHRERGGYRYEAGAVWMIKRTANPIKQPSKVLDIQDYLKERNERDFVLFVLGVATGYRAGDLVKLQVRDVKEALREWRWIFIFKICKRAFGKRKGMGAVYSCHPSYSLNPNCFKLIALINASTTRTGSFTTTRNCCS